MELFKYVVPARIDVLQRQLIRFTQPSEFNDPWEALPKFDAFFQQELVDTFKDEVIDEHRQGRYEELLEKEIAKSRERYGVDLSSEQREIIRQAFKKEFIPNAEKEISHMADTTLGLKTQDLRDRFNKSTFDTLNKLVGILCFSEIPDSLLMWSHYADSHKGFVIGFDSTHPFFDQRKSKNDLIRKVKPVAYAKTRPSFSGFSKHYNESEIFKFADQVLLTKASFWAHEREWRMVHVLSEATESIGNPPSVFLFKFPPECISSITLGCRIDNSIEDLVRTSLEIQDFSHVHLFRAEQDRNDYKLNIVESE